LRRVVSAVTVVSGGDVVRSGTDGEIESVVAGVDSGGVEKGLLWTGSGGGTTSKIYDNDHLHIYTDNYMYLEATNIYLNAPSVYSNNLLLQGNGTDAYIYPMNSGGNLYIGVNNYRSAIAIDGTSLNVNIYRNLSSYGNAEFGTHNSSNLEKTGYVALCAGSTASGGNYPGYVQFWDATKVIGYIGYAYQGYLGLDIYDSSYLGYSCNKNIKAVSFISTSDYRLKTNVQPISKTIDNLKPVEYDLSGNKHDMGFIAHEVQEEFPFLVEGEKDGISMQSLNYNGFIALLVKEVQDLKKENKNLKERLDKLEKMLLEK
jgi:hypothetical protein